jgi:ectoine hydroxylase-related dioxygenase (phytanoyl-CoA dioxygenase family)
MSTIQNAGKPRTIGASKPISMETLAELKQEFELNGFLYLPGFLSKDEIEFCTDVLYRLDKTMDFSIQSRPRKPGDPLQVRNLLAQASEFIEYIDREPVLMLVSYLLGNNIHVCNTQAFIKPGFPPNTNLEEQASFGWHVDHQHNYEFVNGNVPRTSIRAGYFLSALDEPNMGSLKIVPGSHRYAGKPPLNPETKEPYGTVELLMEAGSLVFLDNRMWHGQCLNYSDRARVNFYIEYCARWIRPFDRFDYSEEFMNSFDPVRKQLLGGAFTDMNEGYMGYTQPKDEDVPLKAWLAQRGLNIPRTAGNVPIGEMF